VEFFAPLMKFIPLSPGLRMPSLTSPLDWVGATLDSRCAGMWWTADWVGATLDSRCAGMWWTAEQRCPHFSRRSHNKPTRVGFCDSFDSICLSGEWSKAWLLLHHLCPFKTLYIPLYYGWPLRTIKLKENVLLDDILAETSKINWKWKGKSTFRHIMMGDAL
jgi:hypothetical protein